jgi:hypothetical protein
VAGAEEPAFAEPSRYAETAMPHLAVVRLGAGHSPNAEVPDAFNAALIGFLAADRR